LKQHLKCYINEGDLPMSAYFRNILTFTV